MNSVETLYRIWVYLQTEPLFWLTITIGAFLVGDYLYKKSNINPLVNPVAISILIVSGILIIFDIEYERYFNGAQFIHFLLGPATVALAIPIYNQIKLIAKGSFKYYDYIVSWILICNFITYYLTSFGLDEQLILSMLPRSVTAPIATGISELIDGLPSLSQLLPLLLVLLVHHFQLLF